MYIGGFLHARDDSVVIALGQNYQLTMDDLENDGVWVDQSYDHHLKHGRAYHTITLVPTEIVECQVTTTSTKTTSTTTTSKRTTTKISTSTSTTTSSNGATNGKIQNTFALISFFTLAILKQMKQ